MTNIKLLPLPEGEASSFGDYQVHDNEAMIEYARANVALNTALLRAEIKALRETLATLKAENENLREVLEYADNELEWLDEDADTCDHSVGVCMCWYWDMRRKMKVTLAKENKDE